MSARALAFALALSGAMSAFQINECTAQQGPEVSIGALEAILNEAKNTLSTSRDDLERLRAIDQLGKVAGTGPASVAASGYRPVRIAAVAALLGELPSDPAKSSLLRYAAADALFASASRSAPLVVGLLHDLPASVARGKVVFQLGSSSSTMVEVTDPVVIARLAQSQAALAKSDPDAGTTLTEFQARLDFLQAIAGGPVAFPAPSFAAGALVDFTATKRTTAYAKPEPWRSVHAALFAAAQSAGDQIRGDCARALADETKVADMVADKNALVCKQLITQLATLSTVTDPFVALSTVAAFENFVKLTGDKEALLITEQSDPNRQHLITELDRLISATPHRAVREKAARTLVRVAACPLSTTTADLLRTKLSTALAKASPEVRPWLAQGLQRLAESTIPAGMAGSAGGTAPPVVANPPPAPTGNPPPAMGVSSTPSPFFAADGVSTVAESAARASDASSAIGAASTAGAVTAAFGPGPRTFAEAKRPLTRVLPANRQPGRRGDFPLPQNQLSGLRLPGVPAAESEIAVGAITFPTRTNVGGASLVNVGGTTAPGALRVAPTPPPKP